MPAPRPRHALLVLVALALLAALARAGDGSPQCVRGTVLVSLDDPAEGEGCVAVDKRGARRSDDEGNPLRQGEWITRWPDGALRSRCNWQEGRREGTCFYWEPWGAQRARVEFRRGLPEGEIQLLHPNRRPALTATARGGLLEGKAVARDAKGRSLVEGAFDHGRRQGEWRFYYPSGALRSVGRYRDGKPAAGWSCVSASGEPGEVTMRFREPPEAGSLMRWLLERGRLVDPVSCSTDDPAARCAAIDGADPDARDVEACRQAVDAQPEAPAAWAALGRALGRAGQAGEGSEALARASDLAPDDPALAGEAGWRANRAHRDALAARLLGRARDLDPEGFLGHPEWQGALRQSAEGEAGAAGALGSQGSGFFVSAAGHLLTNHHVVRGCATVTARQGEEVRPTRLLAVDEENDLALLQVEGEVAGTLPLRAEPALRAGEDVVAVGFPLSSILGTDPTVSTGIVNSLSGLGDDPRFLQMSAQVQSGSSGGSLLDGAGSVVGVVVATLDARKVLEVTGDIPQNVNFAVRVERAAAFLDAQGVRWQGHGAGGRLDTAEVAERGRAAALLLECRY